MKWSPKLPEREQSWLPRSTSRRNSHAADPAEGRQILHLR